MAASQAENTKRAYEHSWNVFTEWCIGAGKNPMPASPETARLFVSWCLSAKKYRLETVRTHLSGIKSRHLKRREPSPIDDSVRALVKSAARRLREKPGGKLALTPQQLRKICEATAQEGTALAIRDRALLLVGFAGAFRRSDLSALHIQDVRFVKEGVAVSIWKTKTDQTGQGRLIGIPPGEANVTCPVGALKAWIQLRGETPGRLFKRVYPSGRVAEKGGITGESVNETIKRWLSKIGVDGADFGAHSLRAGFVTAAGDAGASHITIMRRTGHRSVQTVMRYLRPTQAFASNPLAGVL